MHETRTVLSLVVLITVLPGGYAPLPPGCTNLADVPLATDDPGEMWGHNDELAEVIPPQRLGAWRVNRSIPTQHFAINQCKRNPAPIRLMPYSAVMNHEGITYDAYTLERWNQTTRTDTMQQQTPSRPGAPWDKVMSVGTNMKQLVSGPDGNPKADFSGRSGIRVGIEGSDEPVWADFGDVWADFKFENGRGGSMDAFLVRGAALLTHRFTNANPVLYPFCLSSINGKEASLPCPEERIISDGGSGYIDAQCLGRTVVKIILRATKVIDIEDVQYAIAPRTNWPGSMNNCGTQCVMYSSGDHVEIYYNIPEEYQNVQLAYAVNVVGRYVVPPDWTNEPMLLSCQGINIAEEMSEKSYHPRNFHIQKNRPRERREVGRLYDCDPGLCHTPTCNVQGSSTSVELVLEFETTIDVSQLQIAVSGSESWTAAMTACNEGGLSCTQEGNTVTAVTTVQSSSGQISYAINKLGFNVWPPNFVTEPYTYVCGTPPGPPTQGPGFCTEPVPESECNDRFCQRVLCSPQSEETQYVKLVIQLDEPIDGLHLVQIAMNTAEEWENFSPMISCTNELCTLSQDQMTVIYCNTIATGVIKYAVNIIGRFIQPPHNWETEPFVAQCGGGGREIDVSREFIFELDEPREKLPHLTRRFAVYFFQPMRASIDADGVHFEETEPGRVFSGFMQIAYLGVGLRGIVANRNYFDSYAGTYPYHPKLSYCAESSGNLGYVNFDWNKQHVDGSHNRDLLMVVMPHQESGIADLIETPFTFRGSTSDSWLLEVEMPPASLDPIPEEVQNIKDNHPLWLENIMNAIERDAADTRLEDECSVGESYWVGKAISMVARLASISRAFGTSHHIALDLRIKNCLDKWLRINDVLKDGNKFRYDTVYGGLLLRSVPEGDPIVPHANFGFPAYSDHHFHLGYFVYTLGYYAQHHASWATENIREILALARDVSSPSQGDEYFPVVRHKDFYMGISWATGMVGGMRQAESSSEAILCYHGVAALGKALNNPVMEGIGRLMLATEIQAVKTYFHVRREELNNVHLFPPLIKEYGVIGQFAEDAIFYYTLNWPCEPHEFPMRHACLVGIQVIPVTSISKYFMDREWADSVMNVCTWAVEPFRAPGAGYIDPDILTPVAKGWGAFCHSATCRAGPAAQLAAAEYVKDLPTREMVSGTGVASTLLWIYGST